MELMSWRLRPAAPFPHLAISHHLHNLVSRNQIEGLQQLQIVDAVNIEGNKFSSVDALTNLTTLRWLNIRQNSISDISNLSGLINLKYLMLDGNHICQIPDAVKNLQNEHLNSRGEWIKLMITGIDRQVGC